MKKSIGEKVNPDREPGQPVPAKKWCDVSEEMQRKN
jgi:hypothetical protein